MKYNMKFSEIRLLFWESFPQFASEYRKTWKQGQYNATIRSTWVDFVDSLHKDGQITDNQASNIIL